MEHRIGEVARRTGLAASAIRYYEREGLIPKADRRGNARVYGVENFDRLSLIELAKSAGFTISETRRLVRGVSKRTHPRPALARTDGSQTGRDGGVASPKPPACVRS